MLLRTLIHERVPEALRGRAFAAYNGARNGAELGALALGGFVVGAFGARTGLLVSGVGPAAIGLALPALSDHHAPAKGAPPMHASKADLSRMVFGEYEGRTVDWDSMRFAFETMPAHFPPDESPFAGLPDDRCQCPHWGYLIKGSFRVTYLDGPDEIVHAGEAYHLRPGHFLQSLEPVELIELSPVARAPDDGTRSPATSARWRHDDARRDRLLAHVPSTSSRRCGTASPSSSEPGSTSPPSA